MRKKPPAWVVRVFIPAPTPNRADIVNGALTTLVGRAESLLRYDVRMDIPFIHGRLALADASELIERYGDAAGFEAAARARASRNNGNVAHFCHWRHIERVIATLTNDQVAGTVH